MNTTSFSLPMADARRITATVNTGTNKNVIWSSSNPNIADVFDNGVVISLSPGSATITATAKDGSGKYANCNVTVTTGVAAGVTFQDANFKQDIVNRLNDMGAGITTSSPIYPYYLSFFLSIYENNPLVTQLNEISKFISLERLYLTNTAVSTLNLTSNTLLTRVSIWDNKPLTTLSVSNLLKLSVLSVSNTKLNSLTLSGANNLRSVYLPDNNLTSLSLTSQTKLEVLHCNNNKLTALTIPSGSYMRSLRCNSNAITSLAVTGCTGLVDLRCQNNQLTSLNVDAIVNNRWYTFLCYNNYLNITEGTTFRNACNIIEAKIPGNTAFSPQMSNQQPNLTVTPSFLRLIDTTSAALTATVASNISNKALTWTSDNTAVARVGTTGIVTRVSRGSATIRCALTAQPSIYVDIPVLMTTTASDGAGTSANPFKIRTKADVLMIGYSTTSDNAATNIQNLGAYYSLEPLDGISIDMQNAVMPPIGFKVGTTSTGGFTGNFNGNSKTIKNMIISQNLNYPLLQQDGNQYGIGLFSYINGGTVSGLNLDNINLSVNASEGFGGGAGLLAGVADMNSRITGVNVKGTISSGSYSSNTGGLIGFLDSKVL